MKAKYFLRGMGIGIFVTALVLTIAFAFYEPKISTADIEKQARALGMEYTDITAKETSAEEDEKDKEESTEEETKEDTENNETAEGESISDDPTDSKEDSKTQEQAKQPEQTTPSTEYKSNQTESSSNKTGTDKTADNETQTGETQTSDSSDAKALISFSVTSGQSSEVVSANLYKAGIISDPNEFNRYLEQNGYDGRIHTGSYRIAPSSTFEQIANAIAY